MDTHNKKMTPNLYKNQVLKDHKVCVPLIPPVSAYWTFVIFDFQVSPDHKNDKVSTSEAHMVNTCLTGLSPSTWALTTCTTKGFIIEMSHLRNKISLRAHYLQSIKIKILNLEHIATWLVVSVRLTELIKYLLSEHIIGHATRFSMNLWCTPYSDGTSSTSQRCYEASV